jgi:hypothetical protein
MKIRGIAVQAVLPCFQAHSSSTFGSLGLKRTIISSKLTPFTLRKAAAYRATSTAEAPVDRVVDVSLFKKHAIISNSAHHNQIINSYNAG